MKKIIVTPNGIQEVELTAEEISQREIDIANATARKQEEEQAKAQKEANKTSAEAKLSALGLTTEEIKALIG
jgi:hypothetical protein